MPDVDPGIFTCTLSPQLLFELVYLFGSWPCAVGCSGSQVSAEGSSSRTQDVMSHFSNKSPVSSQKPEH